MVCNRERDEQHLVTFEADFVASEEAPGSVECSNYGRPFLSIYVEETSSTEESSFRKCDKT